MRTSSQKKSPRKRTPDRVDSDRRMLLVAGLGNPGARHARQRHNVGYLVADAIISRYGLSLRSSRHHAYAADGVIGGARVMVLKPKTFMNASGRSLGSAVRYHKLKARDVLVIYDELDLVLGKVRVKVGGGHAGHNGIRSIMSHIGPDFRRVRVGIGHPGDKNKVYRYVLSDFTQDQLTQIRNTIEAIAESLSILVDGDDSAFMSRVAYLAPPPRPETPCAGTPA